MDCSLPGSSVHVRFQARVLEWVATVFSDSIKAAIDNIKLKEYGCVSIETYKNSW